MIHEQNETVIQICLILKPWLFYYTKETNTQYLSCPRQHLNAKLINSILKQQTKANPPTTTPCKPSSCWIPTIQMETGIQKSKRKKEDEAIHGERSGKVGRTQNSKIIQCSQTITHFSVFF